jgi:hypothetical protein
MPFCRECGKEVEHDWVTCPYCSQTIGPPDLNSQTVQDSVIMGDVNTNINDSASISAAMKTTLKCSECHSTGAILIGCERCGEHAGCSLCIDKIASSRRFSMREHSEDIDWYFDYLGNSPSFDELALYRGECQSCWENNKEFMISLNIESCSESKQRVIEDRKKYLIKRFYITKKDMEAIIDESIESPYEYIAEKAHRTLESLFGAKITAISVCLGYRGQLNDNFGYTDEYITENLQFLTVDSKGDLRAITELEWASYLSTLAPLQEYKGMSPQRLEALKKRARSKTSKNSKIGRIKKSDIKHNKINDD